MFINILASVMIASAIGIGATNIKENTNINNNDINYAYFDESSSEVESYPIYDDENYTIILSANQLNNYTWLNFNNYLYLNVYQEGDELSDALTRVSFPDVYDVILNDAGVWTGENENYISFSISSSSSPSYTIEFNYNSVDDAFDTQCKFILYHLDYIDFGDNAYFVFNSLYYNDIKTAIQADIQANSASADVGESIISAIASGLGLIGDLATEFLTGFSTLFWDSTNNVLTPFAVFALVMLGLAITMAIISLVLNIIRNDSGV